MQSPVWTCPWDLGTDAFAILAQVVVELRLHLGAEFGFALPDRRIFGSLIPFARFLVDEVVRSGLASRSPPSLLILPEFSHAPDVLATFDPFGMEHFDEIVMQVARGEAASVEDSRDGQIELQAHVGSLCGSAFFDRWVETNRRHRQRGVCSERVWTGAGRRVVVVRG